MEINVQFRLFQEVTNQFTAVIVSDNTNQMIHEMIDVQEMIDIQEMTEVQDIQEMTEVQEIMKEKILR